MGASGSTDGAIKRKKKPYYRLEPEKREKTRFDPEENTNFTSQHDASVDKFDYLIVFPLTEGVYTDPLYRKGGKEYGSRISWAEVAHTWSKGVPGTEETKKEAVEKLAEFWKMRCGLYPQGSDELLKLAWTTVAREAIIDTLITSSGLQLKLSADNNKIYCRIRAPIRLLELQAHKESYRLQFRGEVDPGSEDFWNRLTYKKVKKEHKLVALEIEEERVIYKKDQANAILEKLFRAGKISPNDLSVNSEFEVASTWSRRVHTLERIADKVGITNQYKAYSAFTTKPHLRYLFQTYSGVRGSTLFLVKDRLYLTKSILDDFFDMGIFLEEGIVMDVIAMHDANRGDQLTLDALYRRWVTFWRPTAAEAGGALVTSHGYEDGQECMFYERPFAQPLKNVREYFGEKVALYFAWLGFYTVWLLIPAILGALMIVLYSVRGYIYTENHEDWFLISFECCIAVWAVLYKQGWDRHEKAIALKWGTRGYESEEKDRPQFIGEKSEPLRRSFVTNKKETYFPNSSRLYLVIFSFLSVFVITILSSAVVGLVFFLEYLVFYDYKRYHFKFFDWAIVLLLAYIIEVCSYMYMGFSTVLADNENHRTETDYEDSLIGKTVFFKIFNHYGAVFFILFFKGPLLGTCTDTCTYNAQQLLFAIFFLRVLINIKEILFPAIRMSLAACCGSDRSHRDEKTAGREERQPLQTEPDEALLFIQEVKLDKYDGTFHDYAEAVVQFGYVNLFSVVLPFLGIVALLENLLKIRVDAWNLCTFKRRPHICIAEDVGGWAALMDLMSSLGIVCSVAIICFSSQEFAQYSFYYKSVIFLLSQQLLLCLKFLIQQSLPGNPQWVSELAARNEYISDKFAKGVEDTEEDLDSNTVKGNLDDTIDVDGINLFDLRQTKKVSESQYKEMEALESRRRELMGELQRSKLVLENIFQTETFNDLTGIGESKSGLPLGRLTVRIASLTVAVEDMGVLGRNPFIRLRIDIKSTGGSYSSAGPVIGPKSFTTPIKVEAGETQINQPVGPFAPIRTQAAEIVIDMLDSNDEVIGTTVVRLIELSDQESKDFILKFKLRRNSGELAPSETSIFFTGLFQFSKVAPMRALIGKTQGNLKAVEKSIAILKCGKQVQNPLHQNIV